MKLSVVIPVYNEYELLPELIRRVQKVPIHKEIILIDDASTDGTREVIQNTILPAYTNIRFFQHNKNQGKGAAIRTGLPHATGDILIIQDADLEYEPNDYLAILERFKDPAVDVVYGTRFWNIDKKRFVWHWFCNRFLKAHYEIRYLHHFLGIQLLNSLVRVLYSAKISDEATCYKAFRKKVLERFTLRSKGFEFCAEFTAKVRKAGFAIAEVPIAYHPRSHKQGKKLNWKHGFETIYTLFKYRFVD